MFIDGIAQLNDPYVVKKPGRAQKVPKVPDFKQEAKDAVKYEGLPPLEMTQSKSDVVAFHNVKAVFLRKDNKIEQVFSALSTDAYGVVVTEGGNIACYGPKDECSFLAYGTSIKHVNLKGGSVL